MDRKLLAWFYFLSLLHYAELSNQQNQESTFFDALFNAIQRLKFGFTNTKQEINDDSYFKKEIEKKNSPTIVEAVGFCAINGAHCDFLQCLASNFLNSKLAGNIKKTGKLLIDQSLRHAIADSPEILRIACASGGLNVLECLAFKEFLDLMDILDPDEAHKGDEPRDKRSPKVAESAKSRNNHEMVDLVKSKNESINHGNNTNYDDYYDTDSNKGDNKTNNQPIVITDQWKNCTDLIKGESLLNKGTTSKRIEGKVTGKPNKFKKIG